MPSVCKASAARAARPSTRQKPLSSHHSPKRGNSYLPNAHLLGRQEMASLIASNKGNTTRRTGLEGKEARV